MEIKGKSKRKLRKYEKNIYFMVDIRGNLCYDNHVGEFVTIL